MEKEDFIALLSKPGEISLQATTQLDNITEKHPYFQPAHALRLKGLKLYKNFLYNKALKKTAALSTDRSILFEWITSPSFSQNKIANEITRQAERIETPKLEEELDEVLHMNTNEAAKVLDPHLFEAAQTLALGKALDFDKKEAHSFSEWLKVTQAKPIQREGVHKVRDEKITEKQKKQDRKSRLIDDFIAANPKISPAKKAVKEDINPEKDYFPDQLMTETLARVYLEQRNFNKAIRAYKILILKNPKKSGFFADQIRAIEKLQENK